MTLLQASAGTGKTFTIAALTTRYVAEGILPIDRLLVITFTRMATGELRERVRERLVQRLRRPGRRPRRRGRPRRRRDRAAAGASGHRAEVEARRDRLGKAIADFDAATIETTHGFCLQVLYGLGTAGDVDREVTLVEDVSDLMEEVVDDLYLRKFATRPQPARVHRKRGPGDRRVRAQPSRRRARPRRSPTQQDLPSIRRRFAEAVRDEMERRKRALKILTYDDVLLRLRDTLARPRAGPGGLRPPPRALRRRPGRRVPGHRPGAVGHHAPGVRPRAATDPGADRRPQAGHLRLPRRRRARLPATPSRWSSPNGRWTSTGGATRALLEAYDALFGDAQLGYAGHRLSARSGPPRPTRSRGSSAHPSRRRCASGSCTPATASSRSPPKKASAPGRPTRGR